MPIPPAGLIEAARDELASLPADQAQRQYRELHAAVGDAAPHLADGFQLGLQAARVMIRQNTAVVLAGLDPEEVL